MPYVKRGARQSYRSTGQVGNRDSASSTPEPERHGNRGKRWASQLSRLLEAMLELEDSRPFREPVDCHQYPDFYAITTDPPDLSKIQLNFHAGKYNNPEDIARDIRRMLQENTMFFKNRDEKVFEQANRLSWWFESEIRGVLGKYGRLPFDYSAREPEITVQSEVIDIGATNDKQLLLPVTVLSAVDRTKSLTASQSSLSGKRTNNSTQQQNVIVITDSSPRLSTSTSAYLSVASSPAADENGVRGVASLHSLADVDTTWHGGNGDVSGRGGGSSHRTVQMSTADLGGDASPSVSTMLNVSALWCGDLLVQPANQVALSHEGFLVPLKTDGKDLLFTISVHDIVRCAIDKGRGRRHHLFTFIRPSCLENLLATLGGDMPAASSAMLIMDVELTGTSQLSRLVHIFWTMARASAFGPLFSEIDRDTAQELLASNRMYVEPRLAGLMPVVGGGMGVSSGMSLLTTAALSAMPLATEKVTVTGASGAGSNGKALPKKRGLEDAVAMLSKNAAAAALSTDDVVKAVGRERLIRPNGGLAGGGRRSSVEANGVAGNRTSTVAAAASGMRTTKDGRKRALVNSSPSSIVFQTDERDDDWDVSVTTKPPSSSSAIHCEVDLDQPGDDDVVMTGTQLSVRCPITQRIMREPVRNRVCQHAYDREGVTELIRHRAHKAKCPVPGCSNVTPLRMDDMEVDRTLASLLQHHVA